MENNIYFDELNKPENELEQNQILDNELAQFSIGINEYFSLHGNNTRCVIGWQSYTELAVMLVRNGLQEILLRVYSKHERSKNDIFPVSLDTYDLDFIVCDTVEELRKQLIKFLNEEHIKFKLKMAL